MKRTALKGLHYWSRFQPDKGIDFNGFLWVRDGGNLLVDPLPPDSHSEAVIDAAGGVRWILLTNADHLRAAPQLSQRYGAQLLAPLAERSRLGAAAEHVHVWLSGGGDLPAGLEPDLALHELRGGKAEVELVLHLKPLEALLFGDEVRCHRTGRLNLLPDEKLSDKARLVASLRGLADIPFKAVLVGDGDSILYHGREAYEELLASLPGQAAAAADS